MKLGRNFRAPRRAARLALVCLAVQFGAVGAGDPARALTVDLTAKLDAQARGRARAENERLRHRQTGPEVISAPLDRTPLPPAGGPTVVLRSVTFAPDSSFLTDDELREIALHYRGQRLDFRGISKLVREVNDLYAKKGIITAAAVIEPQDLSSGHLAIRLVEGRVGSVAVVGPHVTDNRFILRRIRYARPNGVVDVPTAARDIAWFNASSIAQVRMALAPGAGFGLTDLAFGISEPEPKQLQLFIDNKGAYSTGPNQLSGIYRRYGLLGMDDLVILYGAYSAGAVAGTGQFDLPLTRFGTRLSVSATVSNIRVVNGPSASLNISGHSSSISATLSQTLIVRGGWTITGDLSGFGGNGRSLSAGAPLVDAYTMKLSGGLRLRFDGERGRFAGEIGPVRARVHDRVGGSVRSYGFLSGSVQGSYGFANGIGLTARGAWQMTGSNLLPGNLQFQIGGPTTVRGYPSDGVSGDRGYFLSLEAHRGFEFGQRNADGFAFFDMGEVSTSGSGTTSLASIGLGLSTRVNERGTLEVSLGRPISSAIAGQSPYVVSAGLTIAGF